MKRLIQLLLLLVLSTQANTQSLYKTPSGKKYHLESCHMVRNVSEKVSFERIAELGLEPCKICQPPVTTPLISSFNKAKGQRLETVQCRGITKKGSRCMHRTSIADGYCYQHRPE